MKTTTILLLACALFMCACTKKAEVQCMCHGNGQVKSYDMGMQYKPSSSPTSANAANCDTLGYHDGLDSCDLIIEGKQ